MRIVIFTDLFLPHADGITNSLVHLIQEYVRIGHKVLVVTPKTKGSELVILKDVEIIFLPSVPTGVYPEFMFGFLSSKLLFALRKFSPEIVHIVTPGPVGSMGIFFANLVQTKSVSTFHGYFMEPEYLGIIGIKNRGVKIAQKFLWKFAKTFYDRVDRVITPSDFVKTDLENHDFSKPITVINNAINFLSIKKDSKLHKQFIKKYGLKDKKIVAYIGRLSIEKNIEFLINSFIEVQKKLKNSHLLIIGDGPDKDRLEKIVEKLKLSKKVTFTGEIENKSLVEIDVFGIINVFATGSHSEVQPVSIIEAMYFGLPIVAIKSRGLTEMIKDNGYLISNENKSEFSNAILKILKNINLQKELSKNSFKLSKKYSLKNSAKNHINLYSDLIADVDDNSFLKRLLKSRIIKSFKNLIFLVAVIHFLILNFLFFTRDSLEYFDLIYILDLDKLFPELYSTSTSFFISSIIVLFTYLLIFYRNGKE